MLGIFDLAPTLMVRFKLGGATVTVADLSTQSGTMQTADIANFFAAGADVMVPFSGTPLNLRISNVATDGQGNAFVYWSCASGSLSPTTARSTITTLPTGIPVTNILQTTSSKQGTYTINVANTSMVMVESAYSYKSPVGLLFPNAQNLTNTAYTMPRVSTYIGPTTGAANYTPPLPTNTRNVYNVAVSGVNCSFAY